VGVRNTWIGRDACPCVPRTQTSIHSAIASPEGSPTTQSRNTVSIPDLEGPHLSPGPLTAASHQLPSQQQQSAREPEEAGAFSSAAKDAALSQASSDMTGSQAMAGRSAAIPALLSLSAACSHEEASGEDAARARAGCVETLSELQGEAAVQAPWLCDSHALGTVSPLAKWMLPRGDLDSPSSSLKARRALGWCQEHACDEPASAASTQEAAAGGSGRDCSTCRQGSGEECAAAEHIDTPSFTQQVLSAALQLALGQPHDADNSNSGGRVALAGGEPGRCLSPPGGLLPFLPPIPLSLASRPSSAPASLDIAMAIAGGR
jgi:hypothetical protein